MERVEEGRKDRKEEWCRDHGTVQRYADDQNSCVAAPVRSWRMPCTRAAWYLACRRTFRYLSIPSSVLAQSQVVLSDTVDYDQPRLSSPTDLCSVAGLSSPSAYYYNMLRSGTSPCFCSYAAAGDRWLWGRHAAANSPDVTPAHGSVANVFR
jgi:hypothetical protein